PPARALAPPARPRPAGDDGVVADLRALCPRLRRPGAARLLLHRELVALAGHLDPGEDDPGGTNPSGRLLARNRGTRRPSAPGPRAAASSRGSRSALRRG